MNCPALRIVVAFAAVLLVSCDGGGSALGLTIDKRTTVQFRRDALGAAAPLPVSPRTDSINGAETSVSGQLKKVNADWVMLDKGGKEIWIPKSAILLIEQ